MNDLLQAHPGLVRRVDLLRWCGVMIHHRGSSWRCARRAMWQVQGHQPECGQHATRTLRRELQDRLDAAGTP